MIKIFFNTILSLIFFSALFFNSFILLPKAYALEYYDQHETGWHWYEDPTPDTKDFQPSSLNSLNLQQNLPNHVASIEAIKQKMRQSLDQALLNPTPQNVQYYIALQNQWSNQASRFSRVWQYVLLQHPELNYSLKFPTSQIGRQIYDDQTQQKENTAILRLAKHSGLFYFYRSTCPYCQRFAPILKNFTAKYGITVIPITTDGIALPEFPNSKVDNGQASKFNVTMEPALFTVDPYSNTAVPVSYGLLTEDELKSRILEIASIASIASTASTASIAATTANVTDSTNYTNSTNSANSTNSTNSQNLEGDK